MRNMGGPAQADAGHLLAVFFGTLALAGYVFRLPGSGPRMKILLDAAKKFPVIYILLTVAAFLTAFYMGRQIWMVFLASRRHAAAEHAQEAPKVMTVAP